MSKRHYDDEPSSSSVQKRKFSSGGGGYGDYSEEQESAKHVADHYSARSNQTLQERENSPIIHLKKLNNWIKSVLVQLYTRPGDSVLDLACGKGGDLIKWDEAKVGYYVGVDIAQGSIKDCMTRYNGDTEQQRQKNSFPARLICADCYETRLDEYLAEDAPFDICSCQDAVDCPEWVVPFHLFKLLAEEYDLELVLMKNFHEFVHEYLQKPEFGDLMRRRGALSDGRHGESRLSQDEWEVCYLYLAFVMRKRGPPPSQRRVSKANRGKTFLAEEDIEFLSI